MNNTDFLIFLGLTTDYAITSSDKMVLILDKLVVP
jgi:hypothetical protein